jgi:hypothetical protein
MEDANPLWGASRIHGELLKLGIEVSERLLQPLSFRRRLSTRVRLHAVGLSRVDAKRATEMRCLGRQRIRVKDPDSGIPLADKTI